MIELLAPWSALIVYLLTAVAAVAVLKVSMGTLKDRFDGHEKQDRETHEKMFVQLGALNVQLARMDEKMDRVRTDIQELRK